MCKAHVTLVMESEGFCCKTDLVKMLRPQRHDLLTEGMVVNSPTPGIQVRSSILDSNFSRDF